MTTSTTFYDKLVAIQAKCKAVLEGSVDPLTQPTALLMLSEVNSIVQTQQVIAMMTVIVQELQSAKTAVTQWQDAKGRFFLCAIDGTTVRTYLPDGEAFVPIEPCTPVSQVPASIPAATATLTIATAPTATASHVRMVGMQHLEIPAGALSLEVCVKSGELSTSNGVGVLVPGDKFKWENINGGLSKIEFVGGTPDTEYSIAILRHEVALPKPPENPAAKVVAPAPVVEHPMTAELIPHPAVMVTPTVAPAMAAPAGNAIAH
jgi:hypothetical protein